jgi:hypothetical protein
MEELPIAEHPWGTPWLISHQMNDVSEALADYIGCHPNTVYACSDRQGISSSHPKV